MTILPRLLSLPYQKMAFKARRLILILFCNWDDYADNGYYFLFSETRFFKSQRVFFSGWLSVTFGTQKFNFTGEA
ncbi:hypothetical protein TDIS_1190 [Thermosulfurimonas dismutans]|uniref:Uncharacterized protein n=1 Tax=Thermosulfurimonas dismutans TaxID=999894 RepID=A0A179D3S5_9BACT|nr:hypothetical protein TDIS_1190 [Thermosulfurimonas dismutans]